MTQQPSLVLVRVTAWETALALAQEQHVGLEQQQQLGLEQQLKHHHQQ